MVVVFDLNGKSGEFRLTGNEYTYTCQLSPTDADTLRCLGAYQAPGREVIFKLYEASRTDPVLIQDMIIPDSLPPTPEGMACDIEPLWEVHPEIDPNYGCYAVTCYINSQYYAGTQDTCIQPWLWPVP